MIDEWFLLGGVIYRHDFMLLIRGSKGVLVGSIHFIDQSRENYLGDRNLNWS